MKIISHFKHNVFMVDEAGHVLEHLGAQRKTTYWPRNFTK